MSDHAQHYFVPQPSHWMIVGSFALLFMAGGAAMWFNDADVGRYGVVFGFTLLVFMMFRWFGDVVRESETGKYGKWEDASFRWGMSWFIFSEVMFFAAFFGALFYARVLAVPDLGSLTSKELLWPDFSAQWPSAGPGFKDPFTPMAAWGVPALNTLLLLSSGIYGTTFFMLTGFHGFHVTIGVIMLTTMLFRSFAGHFKPEHHFAFEAVAWYWHFVDVVWLLLFIFVYWV